MSLRAQREDLAVMRRRLGLPPLAGSADDDLARRGVQSLHLFSTEVLPRPADWPADQRVTGYCPLPAAVRAAVGEGTVPPDLAAWLDAGTPPVYFGFGSMPVLDPPYTLRMLSDVCRALGVRGLVGQGWTRFGAPDGDDLRVVGAFNHDLVLPRCRAAVHHGGAGTTGSILTAGLPAVVASVFADQPLWGHRVARLGAGTTLPFQKLTAPTLRAALEQVLAPEVAARARQIGARLRAEDGLRATTDAILAAGGGVLAGETPRRQASP
jgi:sterol 3beta-glucosyltransferase